MEENDGSSAPSTQKRQYEDHSKRTPSTAQRDTSKRGTEKRHEDIEETSSNSPYLMSMAAAEVNQAPSTGAQTPPITGNTCSLCLDVTRPLVRI